MKFFLTLFSLCGSFHAYREVRDLPLTTSIKYLVKLMVLVALVLIVTFVPVLLSSIARFGDWADQNIPPFTIQDGKVKSDVPQPFIAGDHNFRIILDTTGQSAIDTNAAQGILITEDRYTVWTVSPSTVDAVKSRTDDFAGFPNGEVDRRYFRRLIGWLLPVSLPLAYLIAVLLGLLMTLMQSYLFAVVGTMMERSGPSALTMSQLLNIAIHAVTPGAVIVTAYVAMQLPGLNLGLIYLAAYGIFLLGATNACRDHAEEDEDVEA